MSDLRDSLVQSGTLIGYLNTIVYAHNYNDLTNKPQINGVTLQGNKTASEIGLVTPATEAVQSVNGETGDVVLDGNDIAYNANYTVSAKIAAVEGAIPAIPVTSVNGETGDVVLDGSDIRYDANYTVNAKIAAVEGAIPAVSVQSVNGETGIVVLDGDDIEYSAGVTVNDKIDAVEAAIPVVSYPVTSVNTKTGAVVLDGDDIEYSEDVSVNTQINTLMDYIPVYGNTASGSIATFETSLALPLQDCTIAINTSTGVGGANIQRCNDAFVSLWTVDNTFKGSIVWNQLRRDDTTTNTSEGITTEYNETTHLVSITNNNRTSYYSSGSTQITLSNTAPIEDHVYTYLSNTNEDGVCVSQTSGNTLRQTDIVNTVFKGVSGATGFRLRVTNTYDFVTAHPINNTFSFYLNIIDITQLFGSTIADYIYNLEQNEAGAGVAFFKAMYPNDYYAYDSGTNELVGENLAYSDWSDLGTITVGSLDVTTGKLTVTTGTMASGDYQITPLLINALSGTNNIYANTGNTSVKYALSLKDYIDGQ